MSETPEPQYQKFARDVLLVGAATLLTSFSGIILTPLFTKTLGTHDYGIWMQAHVTMMLVAVLANLGMPAAMARFLPAKTDRSEIQEDFYSALAVTFAATLVISLAIVFSADLIARAFFDGATQIVRVTGLIILVAAPHSMYLTLLRAFRQMRAYSLFMIVDVSAQIGLLSYLISSGYGISSIILGVLALRAGLFFVTLLFITRQIGIARPRFTRIREHFSFGLPTIPGGMSAWVVASSDRYVIAYLLGATSVGVYSAAYGLGNLLFMVAAVIALVLGPTLSKLYDEGSIDEVRAHLSYTLKYLLALAIPFVFGAAVLGKEVLTLFTTFDLASEGWRLVPLVALGSLLLSVGIIPGIILSLAKRTRIIALAWGIAALANIALNILIVPHAGILGAAITTVFSYLLSLAIRWHYARREITIDFDWRFILKTLIASSVMSLVVWSMSPDSSVSIIMTIVAGAAVYTAAIVLLRAFKKEEYVFFKKLVLRR